MEAGLLRSSFVAPKPQRRLRTLTRYRRTQIAERRREANRLHKALEDTNIKLDCVATDILGASGRAMLDALVAGTTDPQVLAELAKGKLRAKIPALCKALEGCFEAHHAPVIGAILAHSADVDAAARRYLGPDDTEHIGREELLRRVRAGDAVVLDVRPALEYEAGHIPGALSIPLDDLAERLDELPQDLEIVAYCRGAYCVFSHDAVRLLREHGRRAVRLADGIIEWHAAGEPLATTRS